MGLSHKQTAQIENLGHVCSVPSHERAWISGEIASGPKSTIGRHAFLHFTPAEARRVAGELLDFAAEREPTTNPDRRRFDLMVRLRSIAEEVGDRLLDSPDPSCRSLRQRLLETTDQVDDLIKEVLNAE